MRIFVLLVGRPAHNGTHGIAALLTCYFRRQEAIAVAAVRRREEREARDDATGHDLHAAEASVMHHEDCRWAPMSIQCCTIRSLSLHMH